MKLIELTQGQITQVDDDMFEELSQYKWHAALDSKGRDYYAVRFTSRLFGKRKAVSMHSYICNTPKGMFTDHIDGDTLNNQRENLRICTRSQNGCNRSKQSNNTSGYKGVYRRGGKWQTRIELNQKRIFIGIFFTAEDAARAYDDAAQKLHGEFAKLNFPKEMNHE